MGSYTQHSSSYRLPSSGVDCGDMSDGDNEESFALKESFRELHSLQVMMRNDGGLGLVWFADNFGIS